MAKVGRGYQIGLSWIPDRDGHVPAGAISVAPDIFVARVHQSGDLVPAKVVSRYNKAYCAHSELEHEHTSYEVLCDTCAPGTRSCYKWEHASSGQVPKRAIVGGLTSNGSPLYIAKSEINFEPAVGKVPEGGNCGYFPYGGKEHKSDQYDVLVLDK
ncbi:Natterin-4 [Paragonimus heterotremus]|uniref:Natterin-4 n=1 Tax=Paragonimus heterotremus TaxID=100268 RepID=A0A8J4TKT5_9TREM|nr:Natterin-4 [Paragonimus heterotremus]